MKQYIGVFIIDRKTSDGMVRVEDDEFATRARFPAHFDDDQIRYAIDLMNVAYGRGIDAGREDKAAEIRGALGL